MTSHDAALLDKMTESAGELLFEVSTHEDPFARALLKDLAHHLGRLYGETIRACKGYDGLQDFVANAFLTGMAIEPNFGREEEKEPKFMATGRSPAGEPAPSIGPIDMASAPAPRPATRTVVEDLNEKLPGPPARKRFPFPTGALAQSIQPALQGNSRLAAIRTVKSAADFWLPYIGEGFPEWTKRIEFEWELEEDGKPNFALLTVQPLLQTSDLRDTIFTQLSLDQIRGGDPTINVGLGYRRLFLNNTVLAGFMRS